VIDRSSGCHVLVERTAGRAGARDILLFARCRNERLRLPAFLRHYRALGVDRFFIVDNGSSDGSADVLAGEPDVQLFRTTHSYREAGSGVAWMNALLAEFGVGAWCVTVDVDELLVYPGSEDAPLRQLTAHLERQSHQALACMLLDLYPAGPLQDASWPENEDLVGAAPFFDSGPYERSTVALCPDVLIRGGMRERVFYPEHRARGAVQRAYDGLLDRIAHRIPIARETRWLRARRRRTPPCLTKIPLVHWSRSSRYTSMHWISPLRVAPETGVLLHFKFLADVHARAVEEAARGEYYDAAAEYRRYAATLARNPDATLRNEESVRYEGTSQLVRLGLMRDSAAWAAARAGG
jgi:glycosyl transferase family 2